MVTETTRSVPRNKLRRTLHRLMLSAAVPLCATAPQFAFAAEPSVKAASTSDEIVVTAQRREESIFKVPMSIASFSPELMDTQGVRQIDDISRLTPSLRFSRTAGVAGNNGANIAIRGIFSDVGSATTAIYIDDTPIQIRSVGYFSGNPYPRVFDLERVEVLRGPQGTLFGAGAMGGAVRFITPQPDFEKMRLYGRSEISATQNGELNYEAGIAIGAPINEKVAVQASGWYRHDGGYVDRVDPVTTAPVAKNINDQETYAARLAIALRPFDKLTITPSIYFQNVVGDGREQYWEQYSSDTSYRTGIYNDEPSRDRFYIAALKIEYEGDTVGLVSNTSYFDRVQRQTLDYATYLSALRTGGNPFGTYGNKDTSNALASQDTGQKVIAQEVRLQSADTESFFSWLFGVYYSRADQTFQNISRSGRLPGTISAGFPQIGGYINLVEQVESTDEQLAGFASFDFRVTDALKLTAGVRVTKADFDLFNLRAGPVNSGVTTITDAVQSATSVTPRFVATYEINDDNLVYASASKGFRLGGAQRPVDPGFCAADLATLGLTQSPLDFDSDSLWSYEIGSKNKLFGSRLLVDANFFLIKWKNLQQVVRLPTCSFSYVDNLGDSTAYGGDVTLSLAVTDELMVGATVGYAQNTYDFEIRGGNGILLRDEGDYIGGPNWSGSFFGQYERAITDTTEGYVRVDYSFTGPGVDVNPAAFGYDPGLTPLDTTHYVTLRTGLRLSGFDVSLFANNLLNTDAELSRSHDTIGAPLYYVESYRPRTIGMTVQYRY